jgi:hypothetical protein
MVLGLAHQSAEERFLIVQESRDIGVKRMSADHPQGLVNKLTVEQMKEMAEMGVSMCIQNQTIFSHELNDETLEMIGRLWPPCLQPRPDPMGAVSCGRHSDGDRNPDEVRCSEGT